MDLRVDCVSSATPEIVTVKDRKGGFNREKPYILLEAAIELIGHGHSGHPAAAIYFDGYGGGRALGVLSNPQSAGYLFGQMYGFRFRFIPTWRSGVSP